MSEDLVYLVTVFVGQVQLGLFWHEIHARLLGRYFHVNGFVRLNSNDQLVSSTRAIENVAWNVFELNANLSLALIECFKIINRKKWS